MLLWRISRHRDLDGIGGLRASGRWHDAGQPIVYLAESPAAALLEVCVHTTANDIPPAFILLRVEGPDLDLPEVAPVTLPADWIARPEITRNLGTTWLRETNAVLLRIPSAIVPHTSNFLFNPLHPDARRFRITQALSYPFDLRLKQ